MKITWIKKLWNVLQKSWPYLMYLYHQYIELVEKHCKLCNKCDQVNIRLPKKVWCWLTKMVLPSKQK